MSILRSCYSSFHSEGSSFRGSKVARIFPSDMKGDDGLYSQKSDFESVGLYRAEWSGASKGFRFLNTPACFLFQSLQPSCQWRRKLLFFSFFFSSLSENTKFRRRIVNFFSFFTSFILLSPLWDYNLSISISLHSYILHHLVSRYFSPVLLQ